jgi:hypothetical protein
MVRELRPSVRRLHNLKIDFWRALFALWILFTAPFGCHIRRWVVSHYYLNFLCEVILNFSRGSLSLPWLCSNI